MSSIKGTQSEKKKFKNWNRNGAEAQELIKLFREFDNDPTKGIPYCNLVDKTQIRENVYEKYNFLHCLNPERFYPNFRALRQVYQVEKSREGQIPTTKEQKARLSSEFVYFKFLKYFIYFKLNI